MISPSAPATVYVTAAGSRNPPSEDAVTAFQVRVAVPLAHASFTLAGAEGAPLPTKHSAFALGDVPASLETVAMNLVMPDAARVAVSVTSAPAAAVPDATVAPSPVSTL